MSIGNPEDLLNTAEVAAILDKPIGTLRQWRHRGYGPQGFKIGGSVRYRRGTVDAWVAACEAEEVKEA